MEFLLPEAAMGYTKSELEFQHLCQQFKIDINSLMQEWFTIEFNFSTIEQQRLSKLVIEEFWFNICKFRNFNDELFFPNFFKLVNIILALPHANADAERLFSIITDVRTKKRKFR